MYVFCKYTERSILRILRDNFVLKHLKCRAYLNLEVHFGTVEDWWDRIVYLENRTNSIHYKKIPKSD